MGTEIKDTYFMCECPWCGKASENPKISEECVSYWRTREELRDFIKKHDVMKAHELLEHSIHLAASDVMPKHQEESKSNYDMTGVIEHIRKNPVPDNADRNSKLFKNVAIWAVNQGMSDEEIKKLDEEIISNCPGRNKGEIFSWVKWVKRGERKEINPYEVDMVADMVVGHVKS